MADEEVGVPMESSAPVDTSDATSPDDTREAANSGDAEEPRASTSNDAGQDQNGTTAFFVFSAVHRARVRAELEEQAEGGFKVKIGDIAKRIGELWRELPEEERATYVKQAAENQDRRKANPPPANETTEPPNTTGLPLATVKKIVMLDEEKARASGDAVRCMARAAEMFLAKVAQKAASEASGAARASITFRDLESALGRWKPTGWAESPFMEITNETQQKKVPQQSKAHKEAAEGTRKLDSFFKPVAAKARTKPVSTLEDMQE